LADRRVKPEVVVVVGLGRFGMSLAGELLRGGHEVMGIDLDERLVQAASGELTVVVQADATDETVLRQLGVADVQHAVVAIGDAVQASILATAALSDLGVPDIWAKAQTEQHARILDRVGAHHVVFPERDMGVRIAHRVTGRMLEYVQIDEGFALVETSVPQQFVGRSLVESGIRREFNVNVVGVKPPSGVFTHAQPDTRLVEGAVLLVAGQTRAVERFAAES
jgi:trk system potassium uptake protein